MEQRKSFSSKAARGKSKFCEKAEKFTKNRIEQSKNLCYHKVARPLLPVAESGKREGLYEKGKSLARGDRAFDGDRRIEFIRLRHKRQGRREYRVDRKDGHAGRYRHLHHLLQRRQHGRIPGDQRRGRQGRRKRHRAGHFRAIQGGNGRCRPDFRGVRGQVHGRERGRRQFASDSLRSALGGGGLYGVLREQAKLHVPLRRRNNGHGGLYRLGGHL